MIYLNSFQKRSFVHIIKPKNPFRNRTLMGTEFKVSETPMPASACPDGLAKTYYHLKDTESNKPLSPWHDLEMIPSTFQENHITGIIEISKGKTSKLEISLTEEHNPVMSDTNKNKETGEK